MLPRTSHPHYFTTTPRAALAACHVRMLAEGLRAGPCTRPPLAPTDAHVDINYAAQRAGIVQWTIHMNATSPAFNYSPETCWTGIVYFDRVLATMRFGTSQHYYLLAAVCLSLAAKQNEEYCAPSTRSVLSAFPYGSWTRRDVLRMECDVLKALEYKLECVAPSQAALEVLLADTDMALGVCAVMASAASDERAAVRSGTDEVDEALPPSPSVSRAALVDEDVALVGSSSNNKNSNKNSVGNKNNIGNGLPSNWPPSAPAAHTVSPADSAISRSPPSPPKPADLLCAANEHWPAPLREPAVRAHLVLLARHVQMSMLRRVALHPLSTAHAPLSIGVALLNRAVAAAAHSGGKRAELADVPVVTMPGTGAAVAPSGRVAALPCLAINAKDAQEWARCVDMVKASCEVAPPLARPR